MFITGMFGITEEGFISTVQRIHRDTNDMNDDVVSKAFEDDKAVFKDGYVSNVGKVITIHIKKERNNEKIINAIKEVFSLNGDDLTILVEPFNGW